MQQQIHIPVLAREVIGLLDPKAGERYLDLTAGYGGHASQVLERLGENGRAILVDRDQTAVDHLRKIYKDDSRVDIRRSDFLSASERLQEESQKFDLIFADIGLSSPHLDIASRGFSFSSDGPLDMRMDQTSGQTAAEVVNTFSEAELIRLLHSNGEVRGARRIARAIISSRPLKTTKELASTIAKSTKGFVRPKTVAQVFQALRIAVNDELGQLENSLPIWHSMLAPNGRIAVISFHSLEDRLVKQYMQDHSGNRYDAELVILTKEPVTSTPTEIVLNPRARSAKLRGAQRK